MYCATTNTGYADLIILIADLNSCRIDRDWISTILQNIKKGTKFMMIGSKVDRKNPESVKKVRNFVREFHLEYAEVSAVTGKNVDAVFDKMIR